jgi:hypothetical protein
VFVGMTVRSAGAVQGVMFLLVFPLSFGSNVFVQTTTMPGWLQAFVNVNPLSRAIVPDYATASRKLSGSRRGFPASAVSGPPVSRPGLITARDKRAGSRHGPFGRELGLIVPWTGGVLHTRECARPF